MSFSLLKSLKIVEREQVSLLIESLLSQQECITIGFLNQHGYNLVCKSKEVEQAFNEVDYLFRDGVGIKWACRLTRVEPGANLNGTDFIPKLVEKAKKLPLDIEFFAYGTQEPWLKKGAGNLFKPYSFLYLDGFRDISSYCEHFQKHQSQDKLTVVVLAMGMPKQEMLALELKKLSSSNCFIICGGAIIDFQAGKFTRAPYFFQLMGIEWLYRLFKEPRRLFGRYVIGIPVFFYNLLAKKI
ncbi:WecB/TagA/CpsF family glycosyltransferase [Vibrio europaeus]|uniref:WecB/TagA/CpsF family glycosyltransferase n=1 Tax=Vibrio europaeus TaxID=300876 RepID=UPI00234028BE|nr:WecB/TagA/CpsF family glycosyltransferase [Vibrio europaeus]MDC5852104.1 WecB/TagA/CpsF family glycosyltransferase [Vibrio europaeus]